DVGVDVAAQRVDLTAERAEQALRQAAAHAVAAVQRHAHGALQLEITGHASDVVPYDIHGFALARHGGRFTAGQFLHEGLQVLDIVAVQGAAGQDRKSTRLNSSHVKISYAVFCLKKKKINVKTELIIATSR